MSSDFEKDQYVLVSGIIRRAPRWGKVIHQRGKLVLLFLWSERLGRYTHGTSSYHVSFLTLIEDPPVPEPKSATAIALAYFDQMPPSERLALRQDEFAPFILAYKKRITAPDLDIIWSVGVYYVKVNKL